MSTQSPEALMLHYTQTMMGFLLFNPSPRHVGVIGLGGGSIPKYCYRHLPHTKISVAEISSGVIALRNRFFIPDDDERFSIVCEDGADFVSWCKGEFDVLIVDGFDRNGQPAQLCSTAFYDDCYQALAAEGILVVNICDSGQSVLVSRLRRSFKNKLIVVDGEASGNTIVYAGKGLILGESEDQFVSHRKMIEDAASSLAVASGISHCGRL